MSEWISVKDRLPEENGRYLCIWEDCDKKNIDCVNFRDGFFPWEELLGERLITHWMPLPEPPKED